MFSAAREGDLPSPLSLLHHNLNTPIPAQVIRCFLSDQFLAHRITPSPWKSPLITVIHRKEGGSYLLTGREAILSGKSYRSQNFYEHVLSFVYFKNLWLWLNLDWVVQNCDFPNISPEFFGINFWVYNYVHLSIIFLISWCNPFCIQVPSLSSRKVLIFLFDEVILKFFLVISSFCFATTKSWKNINIRQFLFYIS